LGKNHSSILFFGGLTFSEFRRVLFIGTSFYFYDQKYIDDRDLPVFLNRYLNISANNVMVFHSSYFRTHKSNSVKNILTIHDFTYELYDKGIRKWIHLFHKKNSLKKADKIICVSENTKKDLKKFHPWIDATKIKVIYNGVDHKIFYPLSNKNIYNYSYLLSVGGRNIHKNFQFTLNLMTSNIIKSNSIKLIVVGGEEFNENEINFIKKHNLKDRIIYKASVNDEELNILYNGALALIYPSLYEGFGIPPLEAMSSGCPVICSNTSSLPEVVGDSALFIDVNDYKSAFPHIELVLDQSQRNQITAKGIKQASTFTWEKTAKETINLYKELLDNK
jgi:mannosyltransferase